MFDSIFSPLLKKSTFLLKYQISDKLCKNTCRNLTLHWRKFKDFKMHVMRMRKLNFNDIFKMYLV